MYDVCSVGTIDEKSIQKVRVAKHERDCLFEGKMIEKIFFYYTRTIHIQSLAAPAHYTLRIYVSAAIVCEQTV